MHQAPRHIAISLACCIKTENFDASMCHWNQNCNTRNYKERTLCWKDSTVEKSQGKLTICYSIRRELWTGVVARDDNLWSLMCGNQKSPILRWPMLLWPKSNSIRLFGVESDHQLWCSNSGQCYTHIHRPEQDRWPLCHWSFPFGMELLSFQTTNSVTHK